jgi:phage protein D
MAIASGVRAPRAQITIGGQSFGVLKAQVNQEATKRSSGMVATCALDSFPGGDAFFAGLSDNKGGVTIDDLQVVDGEWNEVSINYETATVSLKGQDGSIVLHQKKSSEKFTNQKRSDIVKTIAQRNGFQAQVAQATLMAGKLFQIDWAKLTDGVSDAAILHKLAELSGARWWVKNKILYFKGKRDIASNYVVHYQAGNPGPSSGDFIALEILLNLQAAKTKEVNVLSWNQKKKQTFSSQKRILGMQGPLIYNYRVPGLEQDHVDDLAKNKADELARHEIEVQVTLVGDPTIDVGMGLQLNGTAFAQTYEMDHISHTISEHGYIMMITAKSARDSASSGGSGPPIPF